MYVFFRFDQSDFARCLREPITLRAKLQKNKPAPPLRCCQLPFERPLCPPPRSPSVFMTTSCPLDPSNGIINPAAVDVHPDHQLGFCSSLFHRKQCLDSVPVSCSSWRATLCPRIYTYIAHYQPATANPLKIIGYVSSCNMLICSVSTKRSLTTYFIHFPTIFPLYNVMQ